MSFGAQDEVINIKADYTAASLTHTHTHVLQMAYQKLLLSKMFFEGAGREKVQGLYNP